MRIVGRFNNLEKLRLARGFTALAYAALYFNLIGVVFSALGWEHGDMMPLFIFGTIVFVGASFSLDHATDSLLHRTKQCDPICECRQEEQA